jgi:hypothetical protein
MSDRPPLTQNRGYGGQPLPGQQPRRNNVWINSRMPDSVSDQAKSASAQVVQNKFAQSEVRELNKGWQDIKFQVVQKLSARQEFQNFTLLQMGEFVGTKALKLLQFSDLMINFNAQNWFSKENLTNNYTQMYERGATVGTDEYGGSELNLPKGDSMNPTHTRAEADDRVTFGDNIKNADRSGIARTMKTGNLEKKQNARGETYFKVDNLQFNPKSRQIFASLNFSRRPHGSNISYGRSQMVLNRNLKENAIYYMGDTFGDLTNFDRFTYNTLYAAFLTNYEEVLVDLIASTLHVRQLDDTMDPGRLLEAHIFSSVSFSNDVSHLIIDQAEANDTVKENIGKFALKHSIRNVMYK